MDIGSYCAEFANEHKSLEVGRVVQVGPMGMTTSKGRSGLDAVGMVVHSTGYKKMCL